MSRIRIPALAAILSLALAVPATAQDNSPTRDAYGGTQGEVLGNFVGGGQGEVADIVPPPAERVPGGGDAPVAERNSPPTRERVESGSPTPVAAGSLPFTGMEAGLVGLAGLALLAGGFAMRRVSRHNA